MSDTGLEKILILQFLRWASLSRDRDLITIVALKSRIIKIGMVVSIIR